ncbi:hypothetical protein BJ994_001126 [Arthrobacter pigmenti]|uniref:DUF6318 domain-containing protein n=1 Tax=Arthrobacter pigmenti TaxID=271432 RepID=A0A846RK54_9MICC|nr:hypothetical protein [Arthrobacter pigmenti]
MSEARPAVNIAVPEKPLLADENSIEGLKAFTEWWFELLNYAYATDDLQPLWAVTNPGCRTCQNIQESITEVYAEGGWMTGGEVSLDGYYTKFRVNIHGSVDAYVSIKQAPVDVYNEAGELINELPEHVDEEANLFRATFVNGTWTTVDYGPIPISND